MSATLTDIGPLTRDLAREYKAEIGGAWDLLKGQELVDAQAKLEQLARYAALVVADPGNVERHRESARHVVSSLKSIAALAHVNMQAVVRDASLRVFGRAVGLLLAAV